MAPLVLFLGNGPKDRFLTLNIRVSQTAICLSAPIVTSWGGPPWTRISSIPTTPPSWPCGRTNAFLHYENFLNVPFPMQMLPLKTLRLKTWKQAVSQSLCDSECTDVTAEYNIHKITLSRNIGSNLDRQLWCGFSCIVHTPESQQSIVSTWHQQCLKICTPLVSRSSQSMQHYGIIATAHQTYFKCTWPNMILPLCPK